MLNLEYDDWLQCCKGVMRIKHKGLYLQWRPYSRLSSEDQTRLMSEGFFNTYVKSGLFAYYPQTWFRGRNFLLKSAGQFRRSTLVSPLLNLIYLSIVRSVSQFYVPERPDDISVHYAGNYLENRLYYKYDYDLFYKELNMRGDHYSHYFKCDIKDFYDGIDLNILFKRIEWGCLRSGNALRPRDILLYKELVSFLGDGRFPLIDNSTASSYLATIIYLDSLDALIHSFLSNHSMIIDFRMIRYVDDLYIMMSVDLDVVGLNSLEQTMFEVLESHLHVLNLSVNKSKSGLRSIGELSDDVKRSLYDDHVHGVPYKMHEHVSDEMVVTFFEELQQQYESTGIRQLDYEKLIIEHFSVPGLNYSPLELYNSVIYTGERIMGTGKVANYFDKVLIDCNNLIRLDPRRLVIAVMKTKSETTIKLLLRNLFECHRHDNWTSYETTMLLTYLLQRSFRHPDGLELLELKEPNTFQFYEAGIKSCFLDAYNGADIMSKFISISSIMKDDVVFYLFTLYRVELEKGNTMTAYAYYKNFFDRISAHLGSQSKKKVSFKAYYKESELKTLYASCSPAETIIKKAHEIRNESPLSHSSAGLISGNKYTEAEIRTTIRELQSLIDHLIAERVGVT